MTTACVQCRYDLSGTPPIYKGVRTCPECGKVNVPGEPQYVRPVSLGVRLLGWFFGIAGVTVFNVAVLGAVMASTHGSNPFVLPMWITLGLSLAEAFPCALITVRKPRHGAVVAMAWLGFSLLLCAAAAGTLMGAVYLAFSSIRC